MAILNPPMWLQQGSYDARHDRVALIGLLGARGVSARAYFNIIPTPTPSMSVTVTPGYAYVTGTNMSYQGIYTVLNDGNFDTPVTPSSTTYPRMDLVVLRVYDAYVAGSQNKAAVEVIPGTPSVNPVLPDMPPSAIELARITVPANASAITASMISLNNKQLAKFQPSMLNLPEQLGTFNDIPRSGLRYAGEEYFVTNSATKYLFDGSKYIPFSDTGWMTLPLAPGFVPWNDNYVPRFRVKNGVVYFDGLVRTTGAVPTPESVMATLPLGARPEQVTPQRICTVTTRDNKFGTVGIYTANGNIVWKGGDYPPQGTAWLSIADITPFPIANPV